MTDAEKIYDIFYQSVLDWHEKNELSPNPHPKGSIEAIFYDKNQIDTRQWHLEDEIRDPAIADADVRRLKQAIDKSNQDRTDMVERIDDFYFQLYNQTESSGELNTETPAWALDRLSILALKVFHMQEEADREDAAPDHKKACAEKVAVLKQQQSDLTSAINKLLGDLKSGAKRMVLYRQMKMYNDPKLNPVLYKKENE